MKAKSATEVKRFQDIPNVGPAMERDFRLLGLTKPQELKHKNAFKLYQQLCKKTGVRHDPCVLYTYIAVVNFMYGAPARPWFYYTKERKAEYPDI